MSYRAPNNLETTGGEGQREREAFLALFDVCERNVRIMSVVTGRTKALIEARLDRYEQEGFKVAYNNDKPRSDFPYSAAIAYDEELAIRRRHYFLETLKNVGYNRTAAAKALRVSLRTVTARISQLRAEGVVIPDSNRQGVALTKERIMAFYAVFAGNNFDREKTALELGLLIGAVATRVSYCRRMGLKVRG